MINREHTAEDDTYYNRERPSLFNRVADGPNIILDLGCGAGMLGRKLLELKKASTLIGVEIYQTVAERAAKWYEKVYIGDIESLELNYTAYFDYVVCGDILEHIKDPYRVMAQIHTWLKPKGRLICSLPNVRNWHVWGKLVFCGKWEYEDSGILDATHLRFFTRKTGLKMIQDAQLEVESCAMLTYGLRKKFLNAMTLKLFEEFMAQQFVVVARKA